MSRFDDLLEEHCPDGVEFKPLGEVGELIRGRRFTKADYAPEGLGSIHYGEIYTEYGVTATTTKSKVQAELKPTLRFAKPGDLIIAATGENLRDVCKAVAWLGSDEIAIHDDCYIFRHSLDPVYVSYFFQSRMFQDQKAAFASESKVVRVSGANLARIEMPVPPGDIQREVVRLLSPFTEFEPTLIDELDARVRQRLSLARSLRGSPYARTVQRGTEVIRLGDIASRYVRPIRVESSDTYINLGVRWYGEGLFARSTRSGRDIKATSLYGVKQGALIFNRMFVTEGSFAIVQKELTNGVVSNEFPVFLLDESRIVPEWLLLYLLDDRTLKRVAAEVTGVERGSTKSRRRWKDDQFLDFRVELPRLEDQVDTLRILGTFTELEGLLRAELAAHRKQYEYYRDRLFDFSRLAA